MIGTRETVQCRTFYPRTRRHELTFPQNSSPPPNVYHFTSTMSNADSFERLTPVMRIKGAFAGKCRLLTGADTAKPQSVYELVKQRPCPKTKSDLNLLIMMFCVHALTLRTNLKASSHKDQRRWTRMNMAIAALTAGTVQYGPSMATIGTGPCMKTKIQSS